jgi:hypothetical protein
MAAPFWRSRPRAIPDDLSTAVVTICGRLMSANVGHRLIFCNPNEDTNGHRSLPSRSQSYAEQCGKARSQEQMWGPAQSHGGSADRAAGLVPAPPAAVSCVLFRGLHAI